MTTMQIAIQKAMDTQEKLLPLTPKMPLVFTVISLTVNPVNGYKKLVKTPIMGEENFNTAVMVYSKKKDELENGYYEGIKGYVKIFLTDVTPDGIILDTGLEIMDYSYTVR